MLYAAQRSEIIVVPGAMYFCMIGSRVAASLRSTGTMNPTLRQLDFTIDLNMIMRSQ